MFPSLDSTLHQRKRWSIKWSHKTWIAWIACRHHEELPLFRLPQRQILKDEVTANHATSQENPKSCLLNWKQEELQLPRMEEYIQDRQTSTSRSKDQKNRSAAVSPENKAAKKKSGARQQKKPKHDITEDRHWDNKLKKTPDPWPWNRKSAKTQLAAQEILLSLRTKKPPDTTIALREAYFINRSGAWKQKKTSKLCSCRGAITDCTPADWHRYVTLQVSKTPAQEHRELNWVGGAASERERRDESRRTAKAEKWKRRAKGIEAEDSGERGTKRWGTWNQRRGQRGESVEEMGEL